MKRPLWTKAEAEAIQRSAAAPLDITPRFASNVFTPNVTKGDTSVRYLLYKRGTLYSATPDGPEFHGHEVRDQCSLGCNCAAFLVTFNDRDAGILASAQRIDSKSEIIR
jgi:hypothetical protein